MSKMVNKAQAIKLIIDINVVCTLHCGFEAIFMHTGFSRNQCIVERRGGTFSRRIISLQSLKILI